ncbi:MAG: hypothetical protein KAI44_03035 [Methylococcales bacterium]|nr:hypothetical protein [Methylococcales bacterium]
MEENYLIGLFVSLLFGFVLFKKESKVSVDTHKIKPSSSYVEASGVSGVAKYLKKQDDELLQSKVTGVAKYLQEKEILNSVNTESLAISGVAKYLATKEEASVSGVSKYMARQAIYAKKVAAEKVSGVEKYLNNRS